jgi:hypothetical protein
VALATVHVNVSVHVFSVTVDDVLAVELVVILQWIKKTGAIETSPITTSVGPIGKTTVDMATNSSATNTLNST